ncbi:MAG: TolC family protein [Candidatus Kapaibacterium sp.]|nr:MAG: TolC family protein [Candidatus Kapabacteria bacterium]
MKTFFSSLAFAAIASTSALTLASQAFAQTVPVNPTNQSTQKLRITLEEAIKMGMGYSKTLHTSQVKVAAAEARIGEANAAMLPSLGVSASYARLSDIPADRQFRFEFNASSLFDISKVDRALLMNPNVAQTFQAIQQATTPRQPVPGEAPPPPAFPILLDNVAFQANITYPVFTGFRLEAQKAAAEYSSQAATQDLVKDKIETEFSIKNAYWTLYKVRELQKLTAETIAQVTARLGDAQNLLKSGLLTTNDVLRLQLQLSNAKITNIDANNAARLSAVALNNTLGLPLGTEVELASTIDYKPAEVPDYEKAIQRSLESRAEVSGTQLRIKAAEEGVRAARGGFLPTLALSGSALEANPNQRFVGRPAEFNFSWQLAAQLSWTVWNWNTSGYQVAQAEAQVAQAEDALSMLKDGIKLEVTQNYLTLQQSREKVAVAQQGVEQANENYRITNEKFKKGLALTSDLTDAETFQLQAKVSYVSSVVDYEIAQARLQKSIGEQPALAGK